MRRRIRSGAGEPPPPLEPLNPLPDSILLPLDPALNRCALEPVVGPGDSVAAGQILAHGPTLAVHASVPGVVQSAGPDGISVRRRDFRATAEFAAPGRPTAAELPAFARDMGLAGMGGSMFPTSTKLAAAERVHTLVANAVECEPGILIDEALLEHDPKPVRAGIECLAGALDVRRIVLAAKRAAAPRLATAADACGADLLAMPDFYPAGAEKLIVRRLLGRMPPAGMLPARLGILVFSIASLWAIGRRMLHGEPSMVRPLTLAVAGQPARNLLVPIGTRIRDVLAAAGAGPALDAPILVAGGLMMGSRVEPDTPVLKGTNAIFVVRAHPRLSRSEQPCILCGACFDACPLGLHPSGMADRIQARLDSDALRAHLSECFLCGACAAVCPSDIPLARYFREGKEWMRNLK